MAISDRLVPLICRRLRIDADKIVPEARFREELKANSLALILLQIDIEEEFNTEISEEDSKDIVSLQSAVEYLALKGIRD